MLIVDLFLQKMSCPKRGYAPVVWWNCQRLTDSCQNFVLSYLMRSLNIRCKQNKHKAHVTKARTAKKKIAS